MRHQKAPESEVRHVNTMIQEPTRHEHLTRMSNEELGRTIQRCEDAIADGSAEVADYEAFVLCQKELARRTWS